MVLVITGFLVVVGVGILAYLRMSKKDVKGIKSAKEKHEVKTANRDLVVKAVGGVGLIGTLVFTAVTALNGIEALEHSRQTLDLSRQTLDNTQKTQAVDRYTKAVEQLGSDSEAVRIGGLYALRSLLDLPEHHQPAVDLLASFVRANAKPPANPPVIRPPEPPFDPSRGGCDVRPPPLQPPADIQIAMEVLAKRNSSGERGQLDLRGAYLVGLELPFQANLVAVRLDRANLAYSQLRLANLETASFERADLSYACLLNARAPSVNTTYANFQRAILTEAEISTDFRCADLRGASLKGTRVPRETILKGTQLQNAYLWEVHLEDSTFSRVDVTDANFEEAHLEGTDLTRVIGLTEAQLSSAHTDAKTKKPLSTQTWAPDCDERR